MSQTASIPFLIAVGTFAVARAALKGAIYVASKVAQAARREQESQTESASLRLSSHATRMKDMETTIEALQDVGFSPSDVNELPADAKGFFQEGGTIEDQKGRRIKLSLSLTDSEGQFLFSLERGSDGFTALTAGGAGRKALQKVAQRYAYLKARRTAEEQGYRVVEEERQLSDGSVETVLRRTSPSEGIQEIRLIYKPAGREGSIDLITQGISPEGRNSCPNLTPFLSALGVKEAYVRPKPLWEVRRAIQRLERYRRASRRQGGYR